LEVADALNLSAIKGCYNAIVCNFLLPYLPETEIGKLFSAVSNLLVPGGMFYLGFITEAHNHSQMVQSSKGHPITMYYYAEQYIAGLLRHHQFMLGFSKSYASNNSRQEQRDIIMVASKQAHANEKLHPL
jgi:O-methyltransferase involved in polyketide biosynthesis